MLSTFYAPCSVPGKGDKDFKQHNTSVLLELMRENEAYFPLKSEFSQGQSLTHAILRELICAENFLYAKHLTHDVSFSTGNNESWVFFFFSDFAAE